MSTTTITTDIDTERRLIAFAGDVSRLADERRDLVLRQLVDDLHFDLMRLEGDDDG